MNENEAIEKLKSDKNLYETETCRSGDGTPDGDLIQALDLAIQALEKHIPKKPKTDDRYIMYICPCCNDFIKVSHNYCPNCGQKIDFGE